MSKNLNPDIPTKPVSCDILSHLAANSSPQGSPSPSDIAAQSLGARFRAVAFIKKRESYLEGENPYDDSSALRHPGSRTACPTVLRPSKPADSNNPAQKFSNQVRARKDSSDPYYPTSTYRAQQGENDENVPERSDHPVTENKQRATAEFIRSMPVEALTKTLVALKHPIQNNSDAAVSLRGGDLNSDWCQRKKHEPEITPPDTPFAQPSPTVGSNGPQDATTPAPTRSVFPGLASKPTATERDTAAYFDSASTRFQALPIDAQLSTLSYLQGDPAMDRARDLGLPLMDMFRCLWYCVLLLCEDENPALRSVLRDPVLYARFRDGLNSNFLAPDDDFVQSARAQNPCLDARLKDPYQRWRIILAFRTVDFPAVAEKGEGEDAMSGGEKGDEEKIEVDSSGLGDMEMST
ncbi:hypothetical protein CHU98_g12590 [Xylaria longipes]|nr:hypothetical protein CHU98_g12590 [Xylaria longipes]